ncbi:MAG: MotA/TolQ/ExbB proton channel family protein [Gammaproteobacteria bacterium]|nr:MotA/TolQ/ExbB proton channel family protein [Gammaproteobacteria bacterium]MDH4314136.1 MotA/TolQ/ExbB proton channel family protein [Gammaproteobacteria bacterium]MDH5212776.1 MotA/TolQ/ExbB proton channel family protein [Gammaproteobacteria bacterium]MDH5501279.1 MotA/TolQ/ExbB proton channel family protein [Gammaproteobacteria bacterium]
MSWASYSDGLATLFEQGGLILWAILFSSVLLWVLIIERYWFHRSQLPGIRAGLRREWDAQSADLTPSLKYRRIEALVSEIRAESNRNILALQALISILPLLGLLGTVSGMIKVFEVITVFGTGNTRGMASGISEALVTTMAGLFTALSGLYFVSDLESRGDEVARHLETELVEDH